jgi:hypothetical protein
VWFDEFVPRQLREAWPVFRCTQQLPNCIQLVYLVIALKDGLFDVKLEDNAPAMLSKDAILLVM